MARWAVHSQAVARLQQGATAAATALPKVMLDQRTASSVRVRAECVINHPSKAIEIEDVEARRGVGAGPWKLRGRVGNDAESKTPNRTARTADGASRQGVRLIVGQARDRRAGDDAPDPAARSAMSKPQATSSHARRLRAPRRRLVFPGAIFDSVFLLSNLGTWAARSSYSCPCFYCSPLRVPPSVGPVRYLRIAETQPQGPRAALLGLSARSPGAGRNTYRY